MKKNNWPERSNSFSYVKTTTPEMPLLNDSSGELINENRINQN